MKTTEPSKVPHLLISEFPMLLGVFLFWIVSILILICFNAPSPLVVVLAVIVTASFCLCALEMVGELFTLSAAAVLHSTQRGFRRYFQSRSAKTKAPATDSPHCQDEKDRRCNDEQHCNSLRITDEVFQAARRQVCRRAEGDNGVTWMLDQDSQDVVVVGERWVMKQLAQHQNSAIRKLATQELHRLRSLFDEYGLVWRD